ncbi:restriction endonuclease subunit S [Photobacterium damselae]|uniref:restriction endonuclease subunit S n=1 Tax=Photobacterium damselae TaxID=38293 RepID=UPI002542FF15
MKTKFKPEGWANVPLESLITFALGGDWGKDPESKLENYTDVYCIRGAEFRHWERDKGHTASLRQVKETSMDSRKLRENDVLVEISGGGPEQPVGRTVLIDKECLSYKPEIPKIATNFLRLIRPSKNVNAKYLNLYLKYFYKSGEVVNYQAGSNNLRNLRFNDYLGIEIPLAPENEQSRIVEKIEELFSELDSGIKSLAKAKQLLSVYRHALLKQAFEGKLTTQWRADNLNQLEDPEKLLSTIRKERQVRYEKMVKAWEVDVGLWEQNGKKGKKPTKPAKLQDISELPSGNQIPDNWVTMAYGDLCSVVRNGVSKKPVGNDGIKIFRISAVRAMKFDMEDYRFISDDNDEFKSFYLERGDLVFTRYNGTRNFVGVAAQYRSNERRLFPDKLIQTRPNLPSIDVAYLERAVNCASSRKFVESRIRTTAGQSGVSGSDIKQIPVPLCSLKEQREINSILDEKLSVIDNLERENELNLQKAELLRQSILKKAFSGKLVSQDPEDEPAIELLKKIAIEKEELAEKEKAEKAAARKKKATAKKTVKS